LGKLNILLVLNEPLRNSKLLPGLSEPVIAEKYLLKPMDL